MRNLIYVLLLYLFSIPSWAAIVQVQHVNKDTSGTSTTLAYSSNVTFPNLLVVAIRAGNGSGSTITVIDSLVNTWSHGDINIDAAGGQSTQLWYTITATSGADTTTVTLNTSSTIRMAQYEFSNISISSPLDIQANSAKGTSTAPASSAFTPNAGNELVVAFAGFNNTETGTTAGTGYTLQDAVPGSGTRFAVETWIQTNATSTTGNFSIPASTAWQDGYAVFRMISGGARRILVQ